MHMLAVLLISLAIISPQMRGEYEELSNFLRGYTNTENSPIRVLSDDLLKLDDIFPNKEKYDPKIKYSYQENFNLIVVEKITSSVDLIIPRCKYLITKDEYLSPCFELVRSHEGINIFENILYSPVFDSISLNYEQDIRRGKPFKFIQHAISILDQWNAHNILEIGSARRELTHAKNQILGCCNDGHSTFYWVDGGFSVTTIDIDPECKKILEKYNFPNLTILTGDAHILLEQIDKPIDLLFLDAWDVIPDTQFAENHLKAYRLIRSKLNDRCMVLIDDTDIANFGKGKLIIPELIKDGFKLTSLGRQALFLRDPKG